MIKITTVKNYDLFIKECRFFFCQDIYGRSWTGKERYIISSNTPEIKLIEKYPEILAALSPYIYCSENCGIALQNSKRNEDKFKKRSFREDSLDFNYNDKDLNTLIPSGSDIESTVISEIMIKEALKVCTPIQRERIIKYYFEGMTLKQIANDKDPKTIKESIDSGLKKMKKFLE